MEVAMLNKTSLFPPRSVHKDWLLGWEFSVTDQDLRDEMLDNPRINHTIIENIAKTNKLPCLNIQSITDELVQTSNIMANDINQFADACGLALMGNALRKLITPKDLSVFTEIFTVHTLQIAMQAKVDYPSYSALNFEPDHLQDVVRKAGYRTIVGWSWSLEPSIGGRIRLLLPAAFSTLSELTETIDPAIATKTIESVSSLMMETNQHQQAA